MHRERVLWSTNTKEDFSLGEYLRSLGFDEMDSVGIDSYFRHTIYNKDDTYLFRLHIHPFCWHGVRVEGALEYMAFVRDWLNPLMLHQSYSEAHVDDQQSEETQTNQPIVVQPQLPKEEKKRRLFRLSVDRQNVQNTTVKLEGET